MGNNAVCPYYVAAINVPGVHAILCCDGQRMVGQLVNGECTADIDEHVRRRCSEPTWRECPYVRDLAYTPDSLGVVVVSVLRACLQGQRPADGGAQRG